MKELLVYIESIIPDEEVKKSWFTLPIIMQSKNTYKCQLKNVQF